MTYKVSLIPRCTITYDYKHFIENLTISIFFWTFANFFYNSAEWRKVFWYGHQLQILLILTKTENMILTQINEIFFRVRKLQLTVYYWFSTGSLIDFPT